MAQAWPPPKPKLSQEDFDEAVSSNIEDFDMEPEEAVKEAVKEFELQGYDLSAVVKTASGAKDVESHPLFVAVQQLQKELDLVDELPAVLDALQTELNKSTGTAAQEVFIVLTKSHVLQHLLSACQKLEKDPSGLTKGLALIRQVLLAPDVRDTFCDNYGPELMTRLLKEQGELGVKAGVAAVAEAACFKVEETKCKFVDLGFIATLLELLQQDNTPAGLVTSACACVRAVTTADDDRPPASKAFMHARMLAKHNAAIKVLLSVLKRFYSGPSEDVAVCCTVLQTVRQVAANEEICREFSDDGGVHACLDVIRHYMSNKEACRAAFGALRQLANSDTVKKLLAESSGIELAHSALGLHSNSEDIVEPVLGLLVSMTLRQPEIVAQAAEAGIPDAVLECMTTHARTAAVQRQGCMLIRNMAVRNPELRPVWLEKGAEAAVRAAKAAHPVACKDVGSAALRDLGLDNYND